MGRKSKRRRLVNSHIEKGSLKSRIQSRKSNVGKNKKSSSKAKAKPDQ
ncbi:hypothetical protein JXM83_04020 [Candidatus Woesearchaeota archaeon]|nr:hypothetical protein [Candidatus Woesearchaeota archaeon]